MRRYKKDEGFICGDPDIGVALSQEDLRQTIQTVENEITKFKREHPIRYFFTSLRGMVIGIFG